MKNISLTIVLVFATTLLISCGPGKKDAVNDREKIRAEIDKILKIQEDAYDLHSDEGRTAIAATCVDSLIFIGGDNGGQATSADFYVHDLADGYSKRPGKRTYGIYDHTVIVTSIHQSFKVFSRDTIYFNVRSTKVFVRVHNNWKMAFVTYAPRPVMYTKAKKVHPSTLKKYVGFYSVSKQAADTVSLVGNSLWIGAGADKSELIPINDSIFFTRDYFGKTGFVWMNGKVTHCYYEFPDGQRLTFPKVPSN